MMRDIAGKRLGVGDKVAVKFNGYPNLLVVRIIGFTRSKVRVEHGEGWKLKYPTQVSLVESANDWCI